MQQWEMWRTCHCGYDFGPPGPPGVGSEPEHPTYERYRTFRCRFWAGILDGLVFLPLGVADHYLTSPERGPFILIAWGAISYSAYWLYSVILHARYGQTLGKMIMKVKVLDLSETRIPTLRQAVIRDSVYIVLNLLSVAYLIYLVLTGRYAVGAEQTMWPGEFLAVAGFGWFLLEIVTMLLNRKRRALHDFLAKTVVVRNP